ncbi:cytochrome-c peroxidase [bacterium]|nr:cytochrome-c peroxidase [bacterium]
MMNKQLFIIPLLCVLVIFLPGCQPSETDPYKNTLDFRLENAIEASLPGQGKISLILPSSTDLLSIPQDPLNPISTEKIHLGQLLFHETACGINPKEAVGRYTYSCASCHHADAGFQAGMVQGIGEGGLGFGVKGESRVPFPGYSLDSIDVQPIRTPSALNIAFQSLVLWNGQFGATGQNIGTEANWTEGTPIETNHLGYEGTEVQAIAGLKVHRMGIDSAMLYELDYKSLFDAAYPDISQADRYTREQAGKAIAAYERTLLASEAPFQRWLNGDYQAMGSAEKRGAMLFFGKANCASCHSGPALNSMEFYALGMNDLEGPGVYGSPDVNANLGRGGFTKNADEMYKFKTPQLYNLKDSPFYGHGGTFKSLREIVDYKNAGSPQNANVPGSQLAPEFKSLGLTYAEVSELVAFLENGLYDPALDRYVPDAVLSGNCFPNNDLRSRIDRDCQ